MQILEYIFFTGNVQPTGKSACNFLKLWNFRELFVDGYPWVVEGGGPHDDPDGAHQASGREHPQEKPVQHHGDELPVLDHLQPLAIKLGQS